MDYAEGLKKDVAEIKFLIHDLRVEWFFSEVIHYHVTLDTDLEIHEVDQVQVLHHADLDELRDQAADVRRSFRDYSAAVTGRSPDTTVLTAGKRLVQAAFDMCELVLNPLWGRSDRVLSLLPPESRSVRSRSHYMNCIRWICGIHYRLDHFLAEQEGRDPYEDFDVAEDIRDFTRNVIYGYAVEKSAARVELRLDRLDRAVVRGRRHRFRRMFFNLVMNAIDAMAGKNVGTVNITAVVEGEKVAIRVEDDGSGMPEEKIAQLLADKASLDGELHSLGFVFVRQTAREFGGSVEISSEVGQGTTTTVRLPHRPGATPTPRKPTNCEELGLLQDADAPPVKRPRRPGEPSPKAVQEKGVSWGAAILEDYRISDAPSPGCIFAIAVTEDDEVEFFTHKPYERLWNITHEDLSPMLFEATVRGRLEEDEEKQPVLVLKAPQSVREYFELKKVAESERTAETHIRMVHDEYIRIARKLISSGVDEGIGVYLTDLGKHFPDSPVLLEKEPFALGVLADLRLSNE